MPDIPIEFSAETLPVAVQIVLALAVTILPLAISFWWVLGQGLPTLQTPAEIREARIIRRSLIYLAVSVFVLTFVVGLIFIVIHTWAPLNSSSDPAPEQRDGGSARLDRFPSEEHQEASPYGGRDGEANGPDQDHRGMIPSIT